VSIKVSGFVSRYWWGKYAIFSRLPNPDNPELKIEDSEKILIQFFPPKKYTKLIQKVLIIRFLPDQFS
jgi:hypothetical protein